MLIVLGDVAVRLRAFEEGDRNYILATWKRSAAEALPHSIKGQPVTPMLFRHIDELVGPTRIVVACSAALESAIFGWACVDDETPWWVYVAHEFRGHKLASHLIGFAASKGTGKEHAA